jgi:hypothetical protein
MAVYRLIWLVQLVQYGSLPFVVSSESICITGLHGKRNRSLRSQCLFVLCYLAHNSQYWVVEDLSKTDWPTWPTPDQPRSVAICVINTRCIVASFVSRFVAEVSDVKANRSSSLLSDRKTSWGWLQAKKRNRDVRYHEKTPPSIFTLP